MRPVRVPGRVGVEMVGLRPPVAGRGVIVGVLGCGAVVRRAVVIRIGRRYVVPREIRGSVHRRRRRARVMRAAVEDPWVSSVRRGRRGRWSRWGARPEALVLGAKARDLRVALVALIVFRRTALRHIVFRTALRHRGGLGVRQALWPWASVFCFDDVELEYPVFCFTWSERESSTVGAFRFAFASLFCASRRFARLRGAIA